MDNIFEFKIDIDKFDYESYCKMKHEYGYYDEILELKNDMKRRIPLITSPSVIVDRIKIPFNYTLGFVTTWEFDRIEVRIFNHYLQFINSLDDIESAYHYCIGKTKNNIMYPTDIIAFYLRKY